MSRTLNRTPSSSALGARYVWEVAADLLCSESQVCALIREGKLRARRIGKRRLIIMPEDVREYLERSRTGERVEEPVG
jgi:excisionase family DNA binding protein